MAGSLYDLAQKLNIEVALKPLLVLEYGSEYTPALKVVFYPDLLHTSAVKSGSTIPAGPAFRNNQSI
jgi:hypothetical protein